MKITKIEKEGKYLTMYGEDGRTAKYDLSTNATIGIKGGRVKGLSYQLGSLTISQFIAMFTGPATYVAYLEYVRAETRLYSYSPMTTLFKKLPMYAKYEQFFAMGVTVSERTFVPRGYGMVSGYAKLVKECDTEYSVGVAELYTAMPNMIRDMMLVAKTNRGFGLDQLIYGAGVYNSMSNTEFGHMPVFLHMVRRMGYNPTALIKYLDRLIVYEGYNAKNVLRDLFDYADEARQMSPTRWERQPKWFASTKRITNRNYERFRETYNEQFFAARIDTRKEMVIGDYAFLYPQTTADIKDEAGQQSHCVASYIDRVIKGECDIIFMRRKDDLKKSLITLEWRNGKINQSRGHQNRQPTAEEEEILGEYERRLIKRLSYNVPPDVGYDVVLDADVMEYEVNSFDIV